MTKREEGGRASNPATPWERPALKYLGRVDDVFQFPGTGKLSIPADDMGDNPLKPKGQDNK